MPKTIFKISSSILESKIDEEIVLMSIDNGFYYGLDPVASRIWEILSKKTSNLENICEELMSEYEIDYNTCKEESLVFINEMIAQGLFEKVET